MGGGSTPSTASSRDSRRKKNTRPECEVCFGMLMLGDVDSACPIALAMAV